MSHRDVYMRYNNGRRGVAANCAGPPLSFHPLLESLTPAAAVAAM